MQSSRKSTSVPADLALWSAIAILLALWSIILVGRNPGRTRHHISDTHYMVTGWVGDNYPAYYPMEVRDVIMFPEDTVHYPIDGDDALQQWESQFPTIGEGWVCLGPKRRRFALTVYHELHCLGSLRRALEDSANRTYDGEHVQHCLNYLRMMTLCRADTTLEPVIDATLAVDIQQPHLCRDWVQVYEEASRNMGECVRPKS